MERQTQTDRLNATSAKRKLLDPSAKKKERLTHITSNIVRENGRK